MLFQFDYSYSGKRKKIIYNPLDINLSELKNLKYNSQLSINDDSSIKENVFLLSQYGFFQSSTNTGLLIFGEIDDSYGLRFKDKFKFFQRIK